MRYMFLHVTYVYVLLLVLLIALLAGCSKQQSSVPQSDSGGSSSTATTATVESESQAGFDVEDPSSIRLDRVDKQSALRVFQAVYRFDIGLVGRWVWPKRESGAESLYLLGLREQGLAEGSWVKDIPDWFPGPYLPPPYTLYEITLTDAGKEYLYEERQHCNWHKYGSYALKIARVRIERVKQLTGISFPVKAMAVSFEYTLELTPAGQALLEHGGFVRIDPGFGLTLEGTELSSVFGRVLEADAVFVEYADGWGFAEGELPLFSEWLYEQTEPLTAITKGREQVPSDDVQPAGVPEAVEGSGPDVEQKLLVNASEPTVADTDLALSGTIAIPVPTGNAEGQRAPDFGLRTLKGEEFLLSSLQGHVVILDFWASWCAPCRSSMPGLKELQKAYQDQGVVMIGVSLDRTEGDAANYLKDNGYDNVIGLWESVSASQKVARLYGVSGIPHTLVLDRDGIIRFSGHPSHITSDLVEALLLERGGDSTEVARSPLPEAESLPSQGHVTVTQKEALTTEPAQAPLDTTHVPAIPGADDDAPITKDDSTPVPKATSRVQDVPEQAATAADPLVTVKERVLEIRLNSLSVSLCSLTRKEGTALLSFVITKVRDGEVSANSVQVVLTDDHENQYSGTLGLRPSVSLDRIHALSTLEDILPVGFSYCKDVEIAIPPAAPVASIQVDDSLPVSLADLTFVSPFLESDFGDSVLSPELPVQLGSFLSLEVGEIEPGLGTWCIPVTIKNDDYNDLSCGIRFIVQDLNGRLLYGTGTRAGDIIVPDLATTSRKLDILPIRGSNQPNIALLIAIFFTNTPPLAEVRFWSVQAQDFPPRVGQGLGDGEKLFIDAYTRNGGHEALGNPLDMPHWYSGNTQPKNEHDIVMQTFPANPKFGQSVIIWDKQADTSTAYVIRDTFLGNYINLGGPFFESESQGATLGGPVNDEEPVTSAFGSKGTMQHFEGGCMVRLEATQQEQGILTVLGTIYDTWNQSETHASSLGLPTSNEYKALPSGARGSDLSGYVQDFEGGHVYLVKTDIDEEDTILLYGEIDELYFQLGASASWLGFPITTVYSNPGCRTPQCDFERGYIASPHSDKYQVYAYEPGNIVFVSDRDGNKEIYLTNARGDCAANLTRNSATDWSPAWSPDGHLIAFVSNRRASKPGIYLMNPDGTGVRFLTWGESPAWFPDGSRIIYTKVGATYTPSGWEPDRLQRLFVISAEGGSPSQLDPNEASSTSKHFVTPVVSPKGTQIAFGIGNWRWGHSYTLYYMNLDGTQLTTLAGGAEPSWSRDGEKIAFRRDTGSSVEPLCIKDLSSQQIVPLSYKSNGGIAWAPDDVALAFSGGKNGYDNNIWIMRSNGSVVRRITTREGNNWDPSWGTIPSRIAYCSAYYSLLDHLFGAKAGPEYKSVLQVGQEIDMLYRRSSNLDESEKEEWAKELRLLHVRRSQTAISLYHRILNELLASAHFAALHSNLEPLLQRVPNYQGELQILLQDASHELADVERFDKQFNQLSRTLSEKFFGPVLEVLSTCIEDAIAQIVDEEHYDLVVRNEEVRRVYETQVTVEVISQSVRETVLSYFQ